MRVLVALALAGGGCFSLNEQSSCDGPCRAPDGGADAAALDGAPDARVCALADPGFMDPAAWQAVGGASVEAGAQGYREGGEGRVTSSGSLAQATCVEAPPPGMGVALELGVSAAATGWVRAIVGGLSQGKPAGNVSGAYEDWTVCIGEGAHGVDVDLTLAAELENGAVAFDSLTLTSVPAAVCPAPGTVRNGDFEDAGGWGSVDRVVVEADGNRALRLAPDAATCCNCASAVGLLSVPTAASIATPALSFRARGTLAVGGHFVIDTNPDGESPQRIHDATALAMSWEPQIVCLPPTHQGRVSTLVLDVYRIPSALCPEPIEAFIDDLAIVDGTGLCN
jgi:hypothetical protein